MSNDVTTGTHTNTHQILVAAERDRLASIVYRIDTATGPAGVIDHLEEHQAIATLHALGRTDPPADLYNARRMLDQGDRSWVALPSQS